jgi:hypothetical protein
VIEYLNGVEGESGAEGEGAYGATSSPSVGDDASGSLALFSTPSLTSQNAGTSDSEDLLSSLENEGNGDFALRIGESNEAHASALESFVGSSALDEALEELLEDGRGLQDEDVLEDQALLELLQGIKRN